MAEQLERPLGFLDAAFFELGGIIGAGVFVLIGLSSGLSGPAVVLAVALAGFVSLLTALSYAEISSAIPKEGGEYEFAHVLLSPTAGLLVGLGWVFAEVTSSAVVSLGFATYLSVLLPGVPLKAAAAGIIAVVTLVNLLGVKFGARTNGVVSVFKVLVLVVFVLAGLTHFDPGNFVPLAPRGLHGMLAGAALFFFAYSGFGKVTRLSEEIQQSERNVPRAILAAITLSTVLYVLTAVALIGAVGWMGATATGAPLAYALGAVGFPHLALLVTVGALAATFSVLLTNNVGMSRVLYALGRRYRALVGFTKLHSHFKTPWKAVLVSGVLAVTLNQLSGIEGVASQASFLFLLFYAAINAAVLLAHQRKDWKPRFRTPAYPLVPLIGIASCLLLLLGLLVHT